MGSLYGLDLLAGHIPNGMRMRPEFTYPKESRIRNEICLKKAGAGKQE
ncbi:hypothetical protein [Komagataeibacter europaeus]|nr:hypothetical protein [Komagataeibacter europaeus]